MAVKFLDTQRVLDQERDVSGKIMPWVSQERCSQLNNLIELISLYLKTKIFRLAFHLVVSECSSEQSVKMYTELTPFC